MDSSPAQPMQLTVLIPALNEEGNIGELIQRSRSVLDRLGPTWEVLVIDGGSRDRTVAEAREAGARALQQEGRGYGGALRTGIKAAAGETIITMDSDLSHEPEVIEKLWEARNRADIVIASRYVEGGSAEMTTYRAVLSRILNAVFTILLRIPVKDISSGFRLYRADAVKAIEFRAEDFDVLEEILILIYNAGGKIAEVPFHYRPRKMGKSHAKLIQFGVAYLRTLGEMWKLRRKSGRGGGE